VPLRLDGSGTVRTPRRVGRAASPHVAPHRKTAVVRACTPVTFTEAPRRPALPGEGVPPEARIA